MQPFLSIQYNNFIAYKKTFFPYNVKQYLYWMCFIELKGYNYI